MRGNIDNSLQVYLGSDDVEELRRFKIWAFGDLFYLADNPLLYMELWNVKHLELLEIKPEGLIYDDLKAMVKLYRESDGIPKNQ